MITFVTDQRHENRAGYSRVGFHRDVVSATGGVTGGVAGGDSSTLRFLPAPAGGWTHDLVVELAKEIEPITRPGADAYLGGDWIGSTEV
ncbi:hypothetical protein [Pseudomonas sp.]|uniref:hypothetical protein n=1 Tax=Pseudomonas sp. TaxID=306 RepID=UPI00299E5FE8|nr:hypothetical protein [Pseudomonas sp.]MDX1366885.1 hypothetical protein [Pseudomonas sp.]